MDKLLSEKNKIHTPDFFGTIIIEDLAGGGGITIVPGPSNNNTKVTINGSYILPSGIIILVDEDIEDYLSNTLVFYDKEFVPVTE